MRRYGVGVLVVSWRPRKVRFAVVHVAGISCGLTQYYVSKDTYARQETAIKKAKKMNARAR